MIWSTPSSRKAQVVARSEFAGGIGISTVCDNDDDDDDEEAAVDMVNIDGQR